jgi:4-aminobutyrate aminotransferase-like enzyme
MSGIITKREIAKSKPWGKPSGSSSSYGGNPLASAAASCALKIIDEEGLVDRSKRMGKYFLDKLMPFVSKFPFVGEVRGSGLMIGIELVKDKASKEPLSKKVTYHLFQECLKRGLLTMCYDARFRIQPAMTIEQETVDEAVQILETVFEQLQKSNRWTENDSHSS